jgi:hypothetical protein
MRNSARRIGRIWREGTPPAGSLPPVPPHVNRLWLELKHYSRQQVFVSLDPEDAAPDWWVITLELPMIADEASQDLGFDPRHPFFEPIALGLAEYDVLSGEGFRQFQRAPHTFSTADRSVLCVQPKSLTPSVGCTLRSLSHHLSLLPGQGQVRARWVLSPFDSDGATPVEDLGLLLVPFPYRVADDAFQVGGIHNSGRWGWFNALTERPVLDEHGRPLRHHIDLAKIDAQSLTPEEEAKHLKDGGEALVVVPDGLLNQEPMLEYIRDTCEVTAIVALPSRTFYSTPKKTYILGLVKKLNRKPQSIPVFTYLISEIGESRDTRRVPIDANDLVQMEQEFRYFRAAPHRYESRDPRCKIIPWEEFVGLRNWLVDRSWTHEEKVALGIVEETFEVDPESFRKLVGDAKAALDRLYEDLA